jgi:hypothetical protein
MQLAYVDAVAQPDAGDNVLNGNGDVVGKVVRCSPAYNGGYDLLAEIRLESVEAGSLSVNNSALNIQELPYKI